VIEVNSVHDRRVLVDRNIIVIRLVTVIGVMGRCRLENRDENDYRKEGKENAPFA
jgi:hypothetical protein